jgi:hypothetical protein
MAALCNVRLGFVAGFGHLLPLAKGSSRTSHLAAFFSAATNRSPEIDARLSIRRNVFAKNAEMCF